MQSFDARRPDFAPYGLACERWQSVPMPRADRHNEIELNLGLNGSLTYLFGGVRVTMGEGRLSAFWAAIPHQVIGSDHAGAEYFVVTIPLVWFLELQLPDRLVQPILHGHVVSEPDGRHFAADRDACARWAEDLAAPRTAQYRAALLEIEARLVRMAIGLPTPEQSLRRAKRRLMANGEQLSKAEQMARYIAQHYTGALSVEAISASVSLHPGYAMTLFHQAFGMTLVECITQHRLSHAQRLLATTTEKILTIAVESGFGSLSRFNEAFKRACGCTPRQHRQRHRMVG